MSGPSIKCELKFISQKPSHLGGNPSHSDAKKTQKPTLYFGAHPKKSSITCSCESTVCQYIWQPPLPLQQKYKSTSELDFARAESWKNKQTGKAPLTRCIPVSWLQPGTDRRQVSATEQCGEQHGPSSPESFPLLGIWGLCLQLSPKMLHPSEASPPFSTKTVSPEVGQHPTLLPSLLHTPAAHRGCDTLLLLSKLPEACQWCVSY